MVYRLEQKWDRGQAFVDDDEDGFIEAVLYDENENGVWEAQFLDDDLDGKANRIFIDENEDKKLIVGYDDDQDGKFFGIDLGTILRSI